jgi:cAMP-dependent protein kinase regulator
MSGQDRDYLNTKVNPILERMVTALLETRPQNPAAFMISWLQREYTAPAQPTPQAHAKDPQDSQGSEDSADEDDEEVSPMRKAKSNQRKGVSSEAYGRWNRKEDFVPRVIEKTPDQRGRILDKIGKAFMFSGLDPGEKEVVVKAMEERHVAPGQNVITQGEDGSELFVVDSGELACTKIFEKGGQPRFLKDYHSGESFGELALLYNAPRAATITAKTPAVLWVLDRSCFNNIVKDSAVRRRERYEEFLKKVPILGDMDPYERSQLADVLKPIVIEAGEYIIREGELGDMFYIIEEGQAKATKVLRPGQPPEEVKAYNDGDYFGELALLRGEPRAANVIAVSVLKCVTLDRHTFKRLLGPLDDIMRRNASKYPGLIKD